MSSGEINISAIQDLMKQLVPYKQRQVRLKRTLDFVDDYQKLYDFIVNDWVVNQPDKEVLMALFITLGFNLTVFVAAVIYKEWEPFCEWLVEYSQKRKEGLH